MARLFEAALILFSCLVKALLMAIPIVKNKSKTTKRDKRALVDSFLN